MYRLITFFSALVFLVSSVANAQTTILAPHIARTNAADFLNVASRSSAAATETREVTYSSATFLPVIRPLNSVTLNNFPVSLTESGTVVLQRARSAADANTILLASGVNGDVQMKLPEVLVFRGTVNGEPNSKVTLCTVKDEIICSIHREDGRDYSIAPSTEPNSTVHYLVSDKEANLKNQPFNCLSEQAALQMKDIALPAYLQPSKTPRTLSTNLLEVRVAIECDTKFYVDLKKDTNKAIGYAIALVSLASLTYEDEVHTVLTIPWLKIWTDNPSDPYNTNGDGVTLADTSRKYWFKNLQNVDRDLVHTITSGGNSGLGYKFTAADGGGGTVICNREWDHSASSPFPDHVLPTLNFTYGVYIVGHEIGHTFGANHSHDCYWNPAYDTCYIYDPNENKCLPPGIKPLPNPGSIMSYCANVNYEYYKDFSYYKQEITFLPKISAYMRGQVESVPCITSATKPALVLSYPRGNEKIDTSNILIRWQSARVQNVKLEYSTDGGTKWVLIIASTPAAEGKYKWYLPVINTSKMIIRVSDVTNENLNDGSVLPFSAHNTTGVSEEPISNASELSSSIIDGELMLDGNLQINEQHLTVILYSINGKVVSKWSIPVSAGHLALKFDVSTIPSGVYNVQVSGTGVRYGKTLMNL